MLKKNRGKRKGRKSGNKTVWGGGEDKFNQDQFYPDLGFWQIFYRYKYVNTHTQHIARSIFQLVAYPFNYGKKGSG